MKKIIVLLLCCGVLVGMVGCGGNTAPPTESPPTTVSEMTITEVPTETIPPTTAVKPTEKEKELLTTESQDQATEPTTTATEPTATAKPKEETNPSEMTKQNESSAAETPKENGCIKRNMCQKTFDKSQSR